jgi:16S rRNA G527 N7-methylase RsmG
VEVVERDLSEVHQCFDLLMFRAFRPLQDVISELDRILAEGGSMCAFKSRKSSVDAELKAVEHVAAGRYHFTQVPYHLPGSEAERRIVRIQRAS